MVFAINFQNQKFIQKTSKIQFLTPFTLNQINSQHTQNKIYFMIFHSNKVTDVVILRPIQAFNSFPHNMMSMEHNGEKRGTKFIH